MNLKNVIIGFCLLVLCMGFACSENKTPSSTPWVPISGTITAKASGITGQSGMTYTLFVYEGDRQTGTSAEKPAGKASGDIDSDPFSINTVIRPCDEAGRPINGVTEYEPGEYTVVFTIGPRDLPYEYYVQVSAAVDGSIMVMAPSWDSWTAL